MSPYRKIAGTEQRERKRSSRPRETNRPRLPWEAFLIGIVLGAATGLGIGIGIRWLNPPDTPTYVPQAGPTLNPEDLRRKERETYKKLQQEIQSLDQQRVAPIRQDDSFLKLDPDRNARITGVPTPLPVPESLE